MQRKECTAVGGCAVGPMQISAPLLPMRIRTLTLEHFRNYPSHTIAFGDDPVHVLLCPNGAGKTNILEAISLLSLVKSCQRAEEADIIAWGAEHYRVRSEVQTDMGEEKTLEVVSQL